MSDHIIQYKNGEVLREVRILDVNQTEYLEVPSFLANSDHLPIVGDEVFIDGSQYLVKFRQWFPPMECEQEGVPLIRLCVSGREGAGGSQQNSQRKDDQ